MRGTNLQCDRTDKGASDKSEPYPSGTGNVTRGTSLLRLRCRIENPVPSDAPIRRLGGRRRVERGRGKFAIAWTVLVVAFGIGARAGDGGETVTRRPRQGNFEVIGMTVPSRMATLGAVLPARIARIPAAEGSIVQEGELLVELDGEVQRARTEVARVAAESSVEVQLAEVRRDHAIREWDRLVKLHGDDHASSKELNDAYAQVEARRLEYELARLEREKALRLYEREQKQLEQFTIRAPFAGYVSSHLKEIGETVDQLEGIVVLAQLDPLEVTADCPVMLAPFIHAGDRALVRPVDSRWKPRTGTVVFASRVADGASQTFKVKLSVPNEDREWLSGLKVVVDFAVDGTSSAALVSGAAGSETVLPSRNGVGARGHNAP